MLRWKPQTTDRILMGLGRQHGPAIDTNARDAIVSESVKDFATQKQDESMAASLNLEKDRLTQSKDLALKGLAQSGSQFGEQKSFNQEKFGKNLAFDQQRFNQNLGLIKDENQFARRQGNVANFISIGGLALSGAGAYKERQQQEQIQSLYQDIIKKTKEQGTQNSDFVARYLEILSSMR